MTTSIITTTSLLPVSYTHLDVYKRQVNKYDCVHYILLDYLLQTHIMYVYIVK